MSRGLSRAWFLGIPAIAFSAVAVASLMFYGNSRTETAGSAQVAIAELEPPTIVKTVHPAKQTRLALILANQDYPASIGRLTNTHTDAATVESALLNIGFRVTKILDADADEMEAALTNFERSIDQEAALGASVVAFFYGSMHGAAVEVDGRTRNFLLPAREEISSIGQVIRKGVRMDQMISGLAETDAAAVLVVSDACRNELATSFAKSGTKGFVVEQSRPGILVAYATSPGATTPDDGIFAKVLAEELVRPGRRASIAMLTAIEEVAQRRSIDGQPFLSSGGLPNWLCLGGCAVVPELLESNTVNLSSEEAKAFVQAVTADTPAAYQAFAAQFPESVHIGYINGKIESLSSKSAPLSFEPPGPKREPARSEPSSSKREPEPIPRHEPGAIIRDRFDDGHAGPEMVILPSGSFTMGSPADELHREDDEGPRTLVTIGRAFAVGRYEVTVSEFDAFIRDTNHDIEESCRAYAVSDWDWQLGKTWRNPGFVQTPDHPVTCVNWSDANAYVRWLSGKTGESYRLLTEAEWEYATRAGTETPFHTGETITTEQANFDGNFTYGGGSRGVFRERTVSVGTFSPNAFGLFEMHGNVWEWVEDCYTIDYSSQPADASAKSTPNCVDRVLRGGSWYDVPLFFRSANRLRNDARNRNYNTGFRLARDLE